VIIFLHHFTDFSQPVCIVISLFIEVRMTTFTHQLLSKKNINARSLTMRVRIFQPQCCVSVAVLRMGYAEVIFIQPGGKLDTI